MDRTEIVFFDVETSVPFRSGQKHALLEFGAIVVCPRRLEELRSYSTLVRPADLSCVSPTSVRCNGITRDALSTAPSFHQVAELVYDMLNGRVWAGHNILRFDCLRIREAFAEIGRPAPEPKGIIDSLELLTRRFGRRAGNMKARIVCYNAEALRLSQFPMATLASYFGLGQQKHRSLDDVRMNLEVVKYCATVLFLESSLPEVLMDDSSNMVKQCHCVAEASCSRDVGSTLTLMTTHKLPSTSMKQPHKVPDSLNMSDSRDPFDLSNFIDEIETTNTSQRDANLLGGKRQSDSSEMMLNPPAVSKGSSSSCSGFLELHQISLVALDASFVPFFGGCQRIALLHNGAPLQICGVNMKIHFGVSSKFLDHSGRPRVSIVVEPPKALCEILDRCDQLARQLSSDSGSDSEWRTTVIRKNGFSKLVPTFRLHIPTATNGEGSAYSTEIYQQEPTGTRKLVFTKTNVSELEPFFLPGTLVDACFRLDVYDYQQHAGIRLVAKKLSLHPSMPVPSPMEVNA
ncbi:NEN1 protein [Nymphaea thermarum]|nr:NEN1 protein [Nymphaea thermarum]